MPALLAVVLVMFSLESRPRPLPQGLAGDVVFGGRRGGGHHPGDRGAGEDRRAGTVGDREAARVDGRGVPHARVQRGGGPLRERRQGPGERDRPPRGTAPGGRCWCVAARDASGVPDAGGSAADTAALIELARVFEGRPSERTIVLASVDGSALGEVGTRRLADRLPNPDLVDGTLVLSGPRRADVASRRRSWAGPTAPTARASGCSAPWPAALREEVERVAEVAEPGRPARAAGVPGGRGLAGPAARAPASTRCGSPAAASWPTPRPRAPSTRSTRTASAAWAAAAFRTCSTPSTAAAPPTRSRGAYVTAVSQVMPGWVLSLLASRSSLPGAGRHGRRVRARSQAAAWRCCPGLAWLGAGAGAVRPRPGPGLRAGAGRRDPRAARRAGGPDRASRSTPPAVAVLVVVLGAVALAWAALRSADRPRLARAWPIRSARGPPWWSDSRWRWPLLVLWLVNPFAALLLTPTLHLWLLATLCRPAAAAARPPRARGRRPPGAGAAGAYQLIALSLDPLSGAWYLLLLVVGRPHWAVLALVWCVLAAVLGAAVAIARSRPQRPDRAEPAERPSVRGPASYAGPGSLGGTRVGAGPALIVRCARSREGSRPPRRTAGRAPHPVPRPPARPA